MTRPIILTCLTTLLFTSSVQAAVRITVQQINPDGYAYSNTCRNTLELCHVFAGIKPQNENIKTDDIELDVGITFQNDKAHFQFKSGWDYLHLKGDKKMHIIPLPENGKTSTSISLIIPSKAAEHDPHDGLTHYPVIRPPHKDLADLRITIEKTD